MGRALIVSAGASSNEYISARLTASAHSSWPNSSGRGALTTISSKSDSSIRRLASAALGTMRGRA